MQIATGAAEADDEPQAPESEKNDVGKRLDAIGEDCPM
jgi:hypothetical protein